VATGARGAERQAGLRHGLAATMKTTAIGWSWVMI
jgi:hypothetical protein